MYNSYVERLNLLSSKVVLRFAVILLLELSNHLPASLLSPELCLVLLLGCDEYDDGGFALSLFGMVFGDDVASAGFLCRGMVGIEGAWSKDTDLCAGGLLGWW